MKFIPIIMLLLFLAVPSVSFADIVPCDGPNCTTCDIFVLGDRVLTFFIEISIAIATIVFAIGGFHMITSAGDTGKVTKGTQMMTDAIVGIVIVLAGWLLIDTVLKVVLNDTFGGQTFGVWNVINCGG